MNTYKKGFLALLCTIIIFTCMGCGNNTESKSSENSRETEESSTYNDNKYKESKSDSNSALTEDQAMKAVEAFIENGGYNRDFKDDAWSYFLKNTTYDINDIEVKSISGVSVSSVSGKYPNSTNGQYVARGNFYATNAKGRFLFSFYAEVTVNASGGCYGGYCYTEFIG